MSSNINDLNSERFGDDGADLVIYLHGNQYIIDLTAVQTDAVLKAIGFKIKGMQDGEINYSVFSDKDIENLIIPRITFFEREDNE